MDWDEVRAIAGHPLADDRRATVHHYSLRRLAGRQGAPGMADVGKHIARRAWRDAAALAYPYGYAAAVGPREVGMAKEAGYVSAVTTRHGVLRPEHAKHLHALPRISLNGRYQRIAHLRTMLSGITTPLANQGKVVVTV